MKKNVISIVILALLIVNIVLSSITMFSVASTNQKTAALVTDISSAISLDLKSSEASPVKNVPIADVVTYDVPEMTIPLKRAEGEDKDHFAVISVTLSMDSKSKEYKKYGEDIDSKASLIKGEISDTVAGFTLDEARSDGHAIEAAILQRVQAMYDSDFIYDVTISGIYQ